MPSASTGEAIPRNAVLEPIVRKCGLSEPDRRLSSFELPKERPRLSVTCQIWMPIAQNVLGRLMAAISDSLPVAPGARGRGTKSAKAGTHALLGAIKLSWRVQLSSSAVGVPTTRVDSAGFERPATAGHGQSGTIRW